MKEYSRLQGHESFSSSEYDSKTGIRVTFVRASRPFVGVAGPGDLTSTELITTTGTILVPCHSAPVTAIIVTY
jgi:hypothetical protein